MLLRFDRTDEFSALWQCWRRGAGQLEPRQWKVGEDSREALVYIPPTAKTTPSPVVFAFHGHGGTMRHAAAALPCTSNGPKPFASTCKA